MAIRIITPDKVAVIYGITKLSYAKRKCLYRLNGSKLSALAYFRTDADADEFDRFLDILMARIEKTSPPQEAP